MLLYKQNGIILKMYCECKTDIGIYECNGTRIDDDTTIVYKMFHSAVVKEGSRASDHKVATLWLCTADIFCKCGSNHHVSSDVPVKYQIYEILEKIENENDLTFMLPDIVPTGSLIVYNLEEINARKVVESLDDWY